MKTIVYIALLLFLIACHSGKNNYNTSTIAEYTGLLEAQGITSYQYGTHTLETDETFYALKSETVNLDDYRDKIITVIAELIEGYPIDGGPKYLNVISLK